MKGSVTIELNSEPGENAVDFEKRLMKYENIFRKLIFKGALDGVRGGSANIHFDENCTYRGIKFDYWTDRA